MEEITVHNPHAICPKCDESRHDCVCEENEQPWMADLRSRMEDLRQKAYVKSPCDLGSDGDNKYRDGVDIVIDTILGRQTHVPWRL